MKPHLLGVAAAALGLVATPAIAQDIDTTAPYSESIGAFGGTNTSTYGQTFTVGSENALDAFTLYLSGDALDFRAYVYAWTGGRAIGNALYGSAITRFDGAAESTPQGFTFDTAGLNLVSGWQYVAFFTTSGIANPNSPTDYMPISGAIGTDSYAGGDFVYTNNGDDIAALTARDWEMPGGVFGDVHFKADFSPGIAAPEPAAWGLLIGGFGLAGGLIRARRRTRATA